MCHQFGRMTYYFPRMHFRIAIIKGLPLNQGGTCETLNILIEILVLIKCLECLLFGVVLIIIIIQGVLEILYGIKPPINTII